MLAYHRHYQWRVSDRTLTATLKPWAAKGSKSRATLEAQSSLDQSTRQVTPYPLSFSVLQARAKARCLTLSAKPFGPFYSIRCTDDISGNIVGTSSGFVVSLLGLQHCDKMEIYNRRLAKDSRQRIRAGPLGLGLLVGLAVLSYGLECGCTTAEILAIYDEDEQHRRLVAYYERVLSFTRLREVGNNGLRDLPDLLLCLPRMSGSGDLDLQAALFLQLEENVCAHYQAAGLKQASRSSFGSPAAEDLPEVLQRASEGLCCSYARAGLSKSQPIADHSNGLIPVMLRKKACVNIPHLYRLLLRAFHSKAEDLHDFDFHYSLVVGDLDYHFNSRDGVHCKPAHAATVRTDTYLGHTCMSPDGVRAAAAHLQATKFTAGSYHPLDNCCIHFAETLCHACLGTSIPAHVLAIPERARQHISELVWPDAANPRQSWLPAFGRLWPSSG
ncbi:hypothetical protein WJX74_002774 [Apatococcus lobatus]|uniref:PPPDE domain-containing protein n=1 Tax=Apatococcus lobatus TaxID=904363 RepID=A0AAW1S9M8_9CHLO